MTGHDTSCADADSGVMTVVVEGGFVVSFSIEIGIGIPIKRSTMIRLRQTGITIVGMIEFVREIHAMEYDTAVAIGITLRIIRHQHEVEGNISQG